MEKIVNKLNETDYFSLQVDESDNYGVDNKSITARFIMKDRKLISLFLGESKSNKIGAVKIVF